jgi:hypothetical protein
MYTQYLANVEMFSFYKNCVQSDIVIVITVGILSPENCVSSRLGIGDSETREQEYRREVEENGQ